MNIKMICPKTLIQYLKIGFIPIPLNEMSTPPMILWSEIYNNPNFWSIEKLTGQADKFYNIATTDLSVLPFSVVSP